MDTIALPTPPRLSGLQSRAMTPSRQAASLVLDQLLAAALGPPPPPAAAPPAALWDALDRLALEQELHALLRRAVDRCGLTPPPRLAAAWQERAWQDEGRGALMRAEAEQALATLAAAGIEALLLKGAALCPVLYGDWSLRPLGDLDLLVREEAAEQALGALVAAGYRLVLGHDELVEGRRGPDLAALVAYHAQVTLRSPMQVVVDLHWHLFDRPVYRHGLSMGPFWERAVPLQIEGLSTWRLQDADMLLHLAAHPFLHHPEWQALEGRWRHDLAAWIRAHPDLDGGAVVARAASCRLLGPLSRALASLPAWCDIPPSLSGPLAAAVPSAAEIAALSWVAEIRPGLWRQAADQLRHLPSWRLRLRFLWRKLLPSPAYLRRRYGRSGAAGSSLALLYLRRWRRLVGLGPSPRPPAAGAEVAAWGPGTLSRPH